MYNRSNYIVFVPMFNEHEKIGSVLQHIRHVIGHRIRCLIVVDDGSTDGSADIAEKFADHVVRLPTNGGNGAATRAALRYITEHCLPCDGIIRIDGDGQHDPDLLPQVIQKIEHGADVVVCSRFHRESDRRHLMLDRLCLNIAIAMMTRCVTKWRVTDARSGFLGFRWEVLGPVIDTLKTVRYGIPIELLLRVWHANPSCRHEEIPHPAMYQKGISNRLDEKYLCETIGDKVGRLDEAYNVFLRTCSELRISP